MGGKIWGFAVVWIYSPFDTSQKVFLWLETFLGGLCNPIPFFCFQASNKGRWLWLAQQLTSISNWVHDQHRHHHPLPHRTQVISSCLPTYEIISCYWKHLLIFRLQHTNNVHHELLKLHHCHKLHSHMFHHHYCQHRTVMLQWIHCWAAFCRKWKTSQKYCKECADKL